MQLIITKYAGKAYCENVHAVIARRLVKPPNAPTKYGHADSVSGYCRPFMSVGTEARPSLKIANAITISGSLVIAQKTIANADSRPQP
jgi:hypothetical protein